MLCRRIECNNPRFSRGIVGEVDMGSFANAAAAAAVGMYVFHPYQQHPFFDGSLKPLIPLAEQY